MKLTAYHKQFLENTVNLNDSRIATLNQRVDAVTSFLRDHPVFGEYFIDVVPQGSFAQRTIIKPVGIKEYDADVLLALTEHPDWTPAQYTAELKKAFEVSSRYKGMAHKRTRCVYLDYADDFHLDVVPYVESRNDITNNKTDDWEHTAPPGFTTWLEQQGRVVGGGRLQAVLRLLKFIRDSKKTFAVKSCLLTILVGQRIDETKTVIDPNYYADLPTALVHIVEDLDEHLQANWYLPRIMDPAGTGQNFAERWDQDGYTVFRTQVHFYAQKIRQAYDEPNKTASLAIWQEVFGDTFTAPAATLEAKTSNEATGEEFIDRTRRFPVRISRRVRLVGRVRRVGMLRSYSLPSRGGMVSKYRTIDFELRDCTVTGPYDVYWKVKNSGREAITAGQPRGQIVKGGTSWVEKTSFVGSHYVEVYLVQNGVVVARDRQQVIIQPRAAA